MVSGSFLLLFASFANKLVGLVSTMILARVLTPEDFGIVAMATILTAFLQTFTTVGSDSYIIRARRPTRQILNTAFTLTFLVRSAAAFAFLLITPFAVDYFNEPDLHWILIAYAIMIFGMGFENPAYHLLKRRQEYSGIIKVIFISKVIAVCIGVYIALIHESYWALVLSTIASAFIMIIGGYVVYPYRPRFSIVYISKQWKFSSWLILQAVIGFARTHLDTFIASTLFGKASLGSYNSMKYLAYIPSENIIMPITTPLFAQLAPLRNNREYFIEKYILSVAMTMFIAIPISAFCFYHSTNIIHFLMGSQWLEFAGLFGLFIFLVSSLGLYHSATRLLVVFSKTKFLFILELIAALLIIAPLVYFDFETILQYAQTKVIVEVLLITLYFLITFRVFTNNKATILIVSLLSVIISVAFICSEISLIFQVSVNPIINLISSGLSFTVCYIGIIYALLYVFKSISVCNYIKLLFDGTAQKGLRLIRLYP